MIQQKFKLLTSTGYETGSYSFYPSKIQTEDPEASIITEAGKKEGEKLSTLHETFGILLFKENRKTMSHFKGRRAVQFCNGPRERAAVVLGSANNYHIDSLFFYLLICIF